jgi:AraC-like DNA-binding protein
MSESTLLRQVKRLTGLSPVQYLQEARLNEARRLLEAKRFKSVSQVASAVGYENVRSFSRTFKKRFGKIPSKV